MRTHSRAAIAIAALALLTSASPVTMNAQDENAAAGPVAEAVGEDFELAKCWAQLFVYVLEEFRADHRDPAGMIEGDFSTREILIRNVDDGDESWAARKLSVRQLMTADLQQVAKELYRAVNR